MLLFSPVMRIAALPAPADAAVFVNAPPVTSTRPPLTCTVSPSSELKAPSAMRRYSSSLFSA